MPSPQNPQIRNFSADFLIYYSQSGGSVAGIHVDGETVWLTLPMIAELFQCGEHVIAQHLQKIFDEGELSQQSSTTLNSCTSTNGHFHESPTITYNLLAVIAVAYRLSSPRAIQFRRWATGILSSFATKGYVLDKERLKDGQLYGQDCFEALTANIKEIRASKRNISQKITDIFATAMDYDADSAATKAFYSAVAGSWLMKAESRLLSRFLALYIDHAEDLATRHILMSMEAWTTKFGVLLRVDENAVADPDRMFQMLQEIDQAFDDGNPVFVQHKLSESDFDNAVKHLHN